jgi:hypothetical protein
MVSRQARKQLLPIQPLAFPGVGCQGDQPATSIYVSVGSLRGRSATSDFVWPRVQQFSHETKPCRMPPRQGNPSIGAYRIDQLDEHSDLAEMHWHKAFFVRWKPTTVRQTH